MDTACSSALVATHLAVKHLQSVGGSSLAGGVNLLLAENTTAATQAAGMLAPDGRCKTLDAAADGYVRCLHWPSRMAVMPVTCLLLQQQACRA